REGLFLAFQYPVEIPGVSNMEFLKVSVDAKRKHLGLPELSSVEFMKLARETSKRVDLDANFLKRGVNEGFSGGEKKRNEIMQMMLLEPDLCILDETDSGLDIDALQVVADGVNSCVTASAVSSWFPTICACAITSCLTTFMFWPMAGSSRPAPRSWPWSWKPRVTAGWKAGKAEA